jgi:hypothetical protein
MNRNKWLAWQCANVASWHTVDILWTRSIDGSSSMVAPPTKQQKT